MFLLIFTGIRLIIAAHGEVSRFVVVGTKYSSLSNSTSDLFAFPGSGYDGQFYWRMATQPWRTDLTLFHGLVLEAPYRLNRPGYPFLAWFVAGGRISLLVWSLVIVNVMSLVALVAVGVRLCRSQAISTWWSLTFLAVPGLIGAWSRDLSEVVVVICLVAGLWAWRTSHILVTGILWSLAALTHESVLPVLAVMLIVMWFEERTSRRNVVKIAISIFAVVVSWQAWIAVHHGGIPLLHGGGGNIGAPFVGLVQSAPHWFRPTNWHHRAEALLIVAQLLAFVVVISMALAARCRGQRIAYAAMMTSALLVISETRSGWQWPFDLRYGAVSMAMAWWILLHGDRKWRRASLVVVPVAFATVALRCVVI